ncbi:MAG: hypothetical protein ABIH39_03535 [Candidatus Margulisiibacteriota bacterium]
MNSRQKAILFATTKCYIENGEPVGSMTLLRSYDMGVSSATIRSEMAWLEENGFLYHPYTSAGRVPTDYGYRFYVDELMHVYHLSNNEQQMIEAQYISPENSFHRILQKTVKFISDFLTCTTLITTPDLEDVYLSGTARLIDNPEFNDVQKIRKVLEILDQKQMLIELLKEELKDNLVLLKIGAETHEPLLEDCSIIAAQYHINNRPAGIISVLTTKRAQYNRIQTAMHSIVRQLDDAFDRATVA